MAPTTDALRSRARSVSDGPEDVPNRSSLAFRSAAHAALGATLALGGASAVLPSQALAQDTDFARRAGAQDPFDGLDVGRYSAPALADLDGDGDLDAVTGEYYGTLTYFENTGSAAAPAFTERTGAANPFDGLDVGRYSAPALADLDGDGDLDLAVGDQGGYLNYFENTGTAAAPAFTERTGAANPFDGLDVGYISAPALVDLDGDGDVDAVAGERDGYLNYFENTGTAGSPAFTERTGAANPFDGLNVDGHSTPAPADLDGDGDLDAVVGEFGGHLNYFENTGTASSPAFTERTGADNLFNGLDAGDRSAPAPADLDGDGDLDLAVGSRNGTLDYFENTDLPDPTPFIAAAPDPFDGLSAGTYSSPALGDLDGDVDADAVVGASDGTLNYFENTGTAGSPVFTERTGAANPFDGFDVGGYSSPALADLDGDGDLDLAVGDQGGYLNYFENTGTAAAPAFTERTGAANPFDGFDVGDRSAPAAGDVDGDGDLDLAVGNKSEDIAYFENTGTVGSPTFTERTGADNPFSDATNAGDAPLGVYSSPALADVGGDGDLDLAVGVEDGTFSYFLNTGTPTVPAFTGRADAENPFDGFDVGDRSTPALADLNDDGAPDAVAGAQDGTLTAFGNGTDTLLPVELTRFTGAADGRAALLRWRTASETNNRGFEVHRLLGGGAFELVGFIEGAGTTANAHSYSLRTDDLPVGTHRFRLKQIDRDGSGAYSKTIEVTIGVGGAYRLSNVYPNPSTSGDPATVRLAVREAQAVTVRVYDALGRRVATLHDGALEAGASHRLRVPAEALAPGMYVVRVRGKTWTATRKMVVAR